MKAFLLVLATVLLCWTQTADGRSGRRRRGVLNLGSVVSCYTGKSVWDVFINYNGYGCYCGFGGKGTPLDEIDTCCSEHDQCYEAAIDCGECPGTMAYTVSPRYNSRNCGTAKTSVTCKQAKTYSDKKTGRCAEKICECDVTFAECLLDKQVDPRYRNHDRSTC